MKCAQCENRNSSKNILFIKSHSTGPRPGDITAQNLDGRELSWNHRSPAEDSALIDLRAPGLPLAAGA